MNKLVGMGNWKKLLTNRVTVKLILLFAAFFILYNDVARWLISQWFSDDVYSHGVIVPFISIYLLWQQRDRFAQIPFSPNYFFSSLIIACCLLLILIARACAVVQLEAISFFIFIPGIVLLVYGWQMFLAVLVPWLYLQFMIPWMDSFLSKFQYIFQLLSAHIGAAILSIKYPIYHEKTLIALPDISMEVAAACSGVNFLVSVLAIGIPLVYLTQRTWVRAVLVLGAGCVLTILSNGLRVAFAGVMGQCYGPEMLHGPGHILQGFFVAWVGWAGLFLINWLFARKFSKDAFPPKLYERWRIMGVDELSKNQDVANNKAKIILWPVFVVFVTCIVVVFMFSPKHIALEKELSAIPLKLAQWDGKNGEWLDAESFFPRADNILQRIYYSADGQIVYLFLAYYEKQSESNRLISRFSRPLHNSVELAQIMPQPTSNSIISVNMGSIVSGGIKYDTLFGYLTPEGKFLAARNEVRLEMLKNGLLTQRNNGAVIIIARPKDISDDTVTSHAKLQLFAKEFFPVLGKFISENSVSRVDFIKDISKNISYQ